MALLIVYSGLRTSQILRIAIYHTGGLRVCGVCCLSSVDTTSAITITPATHVVCFYQLVFTASRTTIIYTCAPPVTIVYFEYVLNHQKNMNVVANSTIIITETHGVRNIMPPSWLSLSSVYVQWRHRYQHPLLSHSSEGEHTMARA